MSIPKIKAILMLSILLIVTALAGCSNKVPAEQYKFNGEGKLVSKIAPDGSKISFSYNELGLPIVINYSDGWVKYGYDGNGNRIWMEDKTGKTEYYYDAFDRPVGVIWKHGPGQLIAYEYDARSYLNSMAIFNLKMLEQEPKYGEIIRGFQQDVSGEARKWRERELKFQQLLQQLQTEDVERRRSWLEQQLAFEVKYRRDLLGNLTDIDTKWGSVKYFYYPEKGQVERRLPNGITSRFSYSPDGLLKSLRHENNSGQPIAEYRYDYNAAGNVAGVHESTSEGLKTTGYIWDTRGYLKELHLPDGNKIHYDYDAMGNRISKEDAAGMILYSYDGFGRLNKAGNFKYEWDKNGYLTDQIGGERKTQIQYDGRGLPFLVRIPDSITRYDWDGDANMISKRAENDVTHYLPNPIAPPGITLGELDGSGKLKSSYLYGDVLLGRRDVTGQMKYFLEDGFNSIRHIADMSGKIIGQRDYTPFAETVNVKGDIGGDFRMAGERFLPEIKSYFIGGRLYEPNLGRYLAPDPFRGYTERFDSLNKYAHGCQAAGIFMAPRCNQTSKRRRELSFSRESYLEESYLDILNRQLKSNYYPVDSKGIPGGMGAVPLPGERIYVNWDDPITWWPITPRNAMPIEGGVAWRFFTIEFGPGSPRKQYGWGGHTLREGYKWTGVGPAPDRVEGHSLAEYFLYDAYRSGGYPALEPFLNKTFRGAGWSPSDVGPNEIATGSYTSSFLFDALFLGLPRSFGIPVGRDISKRSSFERQEDDQKKLFPFPPGGGGPGGSGGPFGENGPFNNPFKSVESKLGGIELAAAAEFVGDLGAITGAVYDPEKQSLVLLGEKNLSGPSIKPEDLAVALILVFGPRPQDPQFSLDPADPKNPKGEWLKAVYIPEEITGGTYFGKTLFDADWLLKQYSFGVKVDEKGKLHERKSSVPRFKSTVDLSFEEQGGEQGKEVWARLWIVSDEMKLKKTGNSIYFDVAKMRVKAKKQVPDPSSPTGLRDVDTEDDPICAKFANLFTELYDQVAKETPEFERLRELAKAMAFAKWLKKEKVPVDISWAVKYLNKRISTVEKVNAISIQRQKQDSKPYSEGGRSGILTTTRKVYLFGGVDLTVNPEYLPDDGKAHGLQEAVKAKLKQPTTGPLFTIEHNGKPIQATVLPITKGGKELWTKSPSVEIDGTVYQFNDRKKVAKSIDGDGAATEYSYDANGGLSKISLSSNSGWKLVGEKEGEVSTWTATNPRGNFLTYKYGNSNYLDKVEADGRIWATCEVDQSGREVTIRYGDYAERIAYDESGNMRKYEVQTERGGSASGTEKLVFDYDASGKLTNVTGVGAPSVGISYTEDGTRPAMITTPLAEIKYSYDLEGRVKKIAHSSGISAVYSYDGKVLTGLQLDHQGRQAEYKFNENGVVQSKDLLGGIADYSFSNGRLSSVKLAQYGEAKYVYDDQNRLREIRIPDGSWIEYQYEEGKGKSVGLQTQVLTVLNHPSSERTKEQRQKTEIRRIQLEEIPRITLEAAKKI